ncbi:DUF1800 domain-containing protein [Algicola sagamiensis]|uniref:DUF1800 domain-containing protein n=1 Tax=Algicola sagamiensis TaxID=163869 RepID=UPI00036FF518|nr:DUF1800 domain-containing protein [Algicola sagamiensis]
MSLCYQYKTHRLFRLKYSLFIQQFLAMLLLFMSGNILAGIVSLNLTDYHSNQAITGTQVVAYRIDENGKRHWYQQQVTNPEGKADFALADIEWGKTYQFGVKSNNNDFRSYSDLLTRIDSYDFIINNVQLTLKNGSDATYPLLKNYWAEILKVKPDGKYAYFDRVVTDNAGQLKVTLQDLNKGQTYVIKAPSPIFPYQYKISPVISEPVQTEFIVGNPALNVSLVDGIHGHPLIGGKVVVYEIKPENKWHWITQGETDDDGNIVFDIDGLDDPERYFLLKSNPFSNSWLYSKQIKAYGHFTFHAGTTSVTVYNGSTRDPNDVLAEQDVGFYKVLPDGKHKWIAGLKTDVHGHGRVNLHGLEDGFDYFASSRSRVGQKPYYRFDLRKEGHYDLVVGHHPVTVSLSNAYDARVLPDRDVTVYKLNEEGKRAYFVNRKTNEAGMITLDLPGLGKDTEYQFGIKAYNNYRVYSKIINAVDDYRFELGKLQIPVTNGSVNPNVSLPNYKVWIVKQDDAGQFKWHSSSQTDDNGLLQLDLPDIGQGATYAIRARSTVDNSEVQSPLISSNGVHPFVIGNPPVAVTLKDATSGNVYTNTKVTAYRILDNGEWQWYRNATTDDNGQVLMDLKEITQGAHYRFKAKVYSHTYSYSQLIQTSGNHEFLIGQVPIALSDKESGHPIQNVKVTGYEILPDGSLKWKSQGTTDSAGYITFDFLGLGEDGKRFVLKAYKPYGSNRSYFGPIVTGAGQVDFILDPDLSGQLDLVTPTIDITTPGGNVANSLGFTLSGVATDNEKILRVDVSLNDPVAGQRQLQANYNESDQSWSVAIQGDWVTQDEQIQFTADAIDYAHNKAQEIRGYLVIKDGTPPSLMITSHQDNDDVFQTGFTVLGTVADEIGIQSITASLVDPILGETIQDRPLNVSSLNGQWAFVVTNGFVSLDHSINIQLEALDYGGNLTTRTLALQTVEPNTSALHIASRISFGMTPEVLDLVKNGHDYLAEQLDPGAIDDSVFESQWEGFIPSDLNQMRQYLLSRMLFSKRQLQEVMAWFWENHFSTNYNTHDNVLYEFQENTAFRTHALGQFRDLLSASAKSPAMIYYLNNAQNRKGAPNENYAREIMELHTLGVDGGYTSTDVAELSKIFTGWQEQDGAFFFNESQHDFSDKTFLGNAIPGNGLQEGETVLNILAIHPSTARYLCGKLIVFFATDTPPLDLSQQCEAEFIASNGNMKSVIQVILGSGVFSQGRARDQVKTPLEFTIASARGFNASVDVSRLQSHLSGMGYHLFTFPVPTGYSEFAEDWVNADALFRRWRFINRAAWHNDALQMDMVQIFSRLGRTSADAIVSMISEIAFMGELTEVQYQLGLDILNSGDVFDIQAPDAPDKLKRVWATLLSLPAFQYQ